MKTLTVLWRAALVSAALLAPAAALGAQTLSLAAGRSLVLERNDPGLYDIDTPAGGTYRLTLRDQAPQGELSLFQKEAGGRVSAVQTNLGSDGRPARTFTWTLQPGRAYTLRLGAGWTRFPLILDVEASAWSGLAGRLAQPFHQSRPTLGPLAVVSERRWTTPPARWEVWTLPGDGLWFWEEEGQLRAQGFRAQGPTPPLSLQGAESWTAAAEDTDLWVALRFGADSSGEAQAALYRYDGRAWLPAGRYRLNQSAPAWLRLGQRLALTLGTEIRDPRSGALLAPSPGPGAQGRYGVQGATLVFLWERREAGLTWWELWNLRGPVWENLNLPQDKNPQALWWNPQSSRGVWGVQAANGAASVHLLAETGLWRPFAPPPAPPRERVLWSHRGESHWWTTWGPGGWVLVRGTGTAWDAPLDLGPAPSDLREAGPGHWAAAFPDENGLKVSVVELP